MPQQLGANYLPTQIGPDTFHQDPYTGQTTNPTSGATNGPDMFGTGMYRPNAIGVNQDAFNNPVGAQAGQQLGSELNNYLANTTQNVTAAQAAYGDQSVYKQGLAGETNLANQYAQMAAGNGPSLAAVQAKQQGAANLAATESMLGSARGAGNPAAAQLAARNAAASGQQQVAQNAVMGRTQEELGAMGAEGGLYGNIAGQGLNEQKLQQAINQFNAGAQNQVAMGNQANTLAANTNYMGELGRQNLAQQEGQIAAQQLNAQTQLGQEQIQAQAWENAAKQNAGLLGSGASGVGTGVGMLALMSDKKLKKNIKPTSKADINRFVSSMVLI